MMDAVSEKIIHFGEYIRWNRVTAGKTTEAFGREVGLTARRLIAIEAMARPDVQHTTMVALAKAFHIDPEEFDKVWQSTPVPVTRRKIGPTTDESRRFGQACAASGISPVEGMRRLRSWFVEQDAKLQKAALGFVPEHRQNATGMFTDPVDHLQDPAEETRQRAGRRAGQESSSEKSAGSASTTAGKRR
jgi:transcriptional regulator with XRE-family HTH domain